MEPSTLSVASVFGLGVAAGLNSFGPLAIIAVLARAGLISLAPPFDAMESNFAVVSLVALAVLEFIGDKDQRFERALHAVLFPVSLASGAILVASQAGAVRSVHPDAAILVGLFAGGITATAVHSARTGMRKVVRGLHLGFVARASSWGEDMLSMALTSAALFAPGLVWLILGFMGVITVLTLYLLYRFGRRALTTVFNWIDQWRKHRAADATASSPLSTAPPLLATYPTREPSETGVAPQVAGAPTDIVLDQPAGPLAARADYPPVISAEPAAGTSIWLEPSPDAAGAATASVFADTYSS